MLTVVLSLSLRQSESITPGKSFLRFWACPVSAVINSDTKAITIILPYGADLKHVAPTIVTANASKVEPSSTQRVDLSTPKAYRVYASNGAYVTYTVTAYTEEPSPTQSLWEKLQNQINSNPNWWELAGIPEKDRLL